MPDASIFSECSILYTDDLYSTVQTAGCIMADSSVSCTLQASVVEYSIVQHSTAEMLEMVLPLPYITAPTALYLLYSPHPPTFSPPPFNQPYPYLLYHCQATPHPLFNHHQPFNLHTVPIHIIRGSSNLESPSPSPSSSASSLSPFCRLSLSRRITSPVSSFIPHLVIPRASPPQSPHAISHR